jgi:hypothetical protein
MILVEPAPMDLVRGQPAIGVGDARDRDVAHHLLEDRSGFGGKRRQYKPQISDVLSDFRAGTGATSRSSSTTGCVFRPGVTARSKMAMQFFLWTRMADDPIETGRVIKLLGKGTRFAMCLGAHDIGRNAENGTASDHWRVARPSIRPFLAPRRSPAMPILQSQRH